MVAVCSHAPLLHLRVDVCGFAVVAVERVSLSRYWNAFVVVVVVVVHHGFFFFLHQFLFLHTHGTWDLSSPTRD